MVEPGRYGEPGPRVRTSPFLFGLLATAGGLLAIVALFGIARVGTVLVMLVAATYFAIGLDRPVQLLVRRGLSRVAAVGIIALAVVALACGLLALVVPPLVHQVDAFFTELPTKLHHALDHGGLGGLSQDTQFGQKLSAAITPPNVAKLATGLLTGASGLVGGIAIAGTTAILTLFVTASLERIRAGAYRLVVASRRDRVSRLADAIQERVGGYLVGAFGIAAIAGTAALLWSLLAGVPYPVLMALVVAFFDLIPQIGATIGSTVVIVVALSASIGLAVATLIFFCSYQGLENWVVYPRVMSRAVKISNLAAIVAAMAGWALFGVLGVLIAVPAYGSVQLLVQEVLLPRQERR
jgi:predicted PurR-regulated permease PerM